MGFDFLSVSLVGIIKHFFSPEFLGISESLHIHKVSHKVINVHYPCHK